MHTTNKINLLQENQEHEVINFVTPKEVAHEIKTNINTKKGFDLITGKILKQIPRKGIVKLTHLFNAAIRLKHVPSIWKVADVIMLPTPGKPPKEINLYRPISLLPVISNCSKKYC